MVRQFSWPVARREEEEEEEEIIYEMVASLRPPSSVHPLKKGRREGGEVRSSQVADRRREEKRHHHAMPKDGGREGERGQGRAWMARAGRAKSCHAEGKGWLSGRGGEAARGGRADGERGGEIARISQIMLTGGVIRDHTGDSAKRS